MPCLVKSYRLNTLALQTRKRRMERFPDYYSNLLLLDVARELSLLGLHRRPDNSKNLNCRFRKFGFSAFFSPEPGEPILCYFCT